MALCKSQEQGLRRPKIGIQTGGLTSPRQHQQADWSQSEITRFVAYLPFGEAFMEQHNKYNSPYKFNGREMDSDKAL